MRPWPILLLFLLVLVFVPAQAGAAPDLAAARRHFHAGTQHFKAGRFNEAAREFESAYAIVRDPVLLFNIGQSYERAGDKQRAIDNYAAYLAQTPTAADRAQVQARLEALRRELDAATGPPPAAQGGERRSEGFQPLRDDGVKPQSNTAKIAGLAVASLGGAALIAAIALGAKARSYANQLSEASRRPGQSFAEVAGLERKGKDFEKAAFVSMGVGLAAAVTGVTILVVDGLRGRSGSERRVGLAPVFAPGLLGGTARLEF